MPEKKRKPKLVPVNELRIGMFVNLVKDERIINLSAEWLNHGFFKNSFLINNESKIEKIKKYYTHVFIDLDQGLDVLEEKKEHELNIIIPDFNILKSKRITLEEESRIATELAKKGIETLKNVMYNAVQNHTIDIQVIESLINEFDESLCRNNDAIVKVLRQLNTAGDSTFNHSLRSAALYLEYCKKRKMDPIIMKKTSLEALLHDIGKITIKEHILCKEGILTTVERDEMNKHSQNGYDLLKQIEELAETEWLITWQHHEKFNGKGYPLGISGEQISIYCRMFSYCDVWDAITSKRCY